MPEKRSYIEWESCISPEEVYSDIVGFVEIAVDNGILYWLEMRPKENGRYAIVRMEGKGKIEDITPKGFNVRTKVHEYGGGSFCVHNNTVFFANYADQRLYRQPVGSDRATPLTPARNSDGSIGKYASMCTNDGKKLILVYEKEHQGRENENLLALANAEKESEPEILASGSDFYADPVLSNDGKKIAWLQWNHPNMPWDESTLMIADFDGSRLSNIKKVDGGNGISICMPKFDRKGALYYIKDVRGAKQDDPENWWNIYKYEKNVERITSGCSEFGDPHWVFGQSTYDFLPDNSIIARAAMLGYESLFRITAKGQVNEIKTEFNNFSSLKCDDKGNLFFIGGSSSDVSRICKLNSQTGSIEVIRKSSGLGLDKENISMPRLVSYRTKDNKESHAYLYMPKNSRFVAPENGKPPLIVMAHGGPTSNAIPCFSFVLQFWTSSGYAVVDVDYRGSTGYGRLYRDALIAEWGNIDASDVHDAVAYLIAAKTIDSGKVAVRGGSAGGYVVQRVMTLYPNMFKAGASYFGIGNLITLVEQTHKFESKYIDNLIGTKLPEGKEEYMERSPINHLDMLKSPMIILQGSDDKIVTPECSREMARILKEKGIEHEYVEYPGEAHGFRAKKNCVDSLMREYEFYRKVFSK
ncbi:S9 family peptidase [Candidatus Woesearchaeota archaeon]|nr:S9 family peptidase [Candidatus Woesearchaeota archaeon]